MTRLQPRRGSYEDAVAAFCGGDFSYCVEILSGQGSAPALILFARALIRLGSPSLALDAIGQLSLSDLSHELAAEAIAVRSLSLVSMRNFKEAAAALVEGRVRCFSSGSAGIEAELLFVDSLIASFQGDVDAAEASALEILGLEQTNAAWGTQTTYGLPLGFWCFRACDLLAGLEHTRGNRAAQLNWAKRAIVEFDKADTRDDFLEASFLANYALLADGAGANDVIDFVVRRAKKISWTPSLVAVEFRLFSALAEASSVAGDQLGALRYFRRCLSCAPNIPLQIRAGVERARIFSQIGEAYSSREELDHAVRLSRSVDWSNVPATDQRQLIFLAGQVASYSGSEAQRLLNLYDEMKVRLKDALVLGDEKSRGEEFFSRAAVLKANGHTGLAITAFIDAFNIWTAAKLTGKAALAASELAELTNDPHYVSIAVAARENRPQPGVVPKLTTFTDEVLNG